MEGFTAYNAFVLTLQLCRQANDNGDNDEAAFVE